MTVFTDFQAFGSQAEEVDVCGRHSGTAVECECYRAVVTIVHIIPHVGDVEDLATAVPCFQRHGTGRGGVIDFLSADDRRMLCTDSLFGCPLFQTLCDKCGHRKNQQDY